jgi:hypothetical protein
MRVFTRLLLVLVVLIGGLALATGTASSSSATASFSTLGAQPFYAPKDGQERYAYAPAAVSDGSSIYYYTCQNSTSGVIQSSIWETKVTDGLVVESQSAVAPSSSGWDSYHTCDPAVAAGSYSYAGTSYSYAMFYAGTDQNAKAHFQIGVAFSNSLSGPWVKYSSPLFGFSSTTEWGDGQPSATSVDTSTGEVLLFYTEDTNAGATGTTWDPSKVTAYRRDITLGDMSSPTIGSAVAITTSGLTSTTGGADGTLNNFDVAYSVARDRFYIVRDRHPYATSDPWDEATQLQVDSIPGSDIWNGTGTWTPDGNIDSTLTSFSRNHDGAILKTAYGTLASETALTVVFGRSTTGTFPDWLWSNDIWSESGTLPSAPTEGPVTWSTTKPNPERVYNPQGGSYYAYAPSVVLGSDGDRYMFTCHNATSDVVRDNIYETVFDSSGNILSDAAVITPTGTGWDSYHDCDPSVAQGTYLYDGTTYSYAMAYLGTDTNCSCHNAIGVAFATSLAGPWVKYPTPIVAFPFGDDTQWGVGQPSITTVDASTGELLLFYTSDSNYNNGSYRYTSSNFANMAAYRSDITLGDMSSPQIGTPVQISTAGLTGTDGSQDVLNGFDMVYDPTTDLFYTVREEHPYPTDDPFNIGDSVQIDSIPGSDIWNGTGTWTDQGTIGPSLTGFARNHNAGFLRNTYGDLVSSGSATIYFTRSALGSGVGPLWTYDIWSIDATF